MATDTARSRSTIAGSLDELVAGATDRVEVRTSDAKSGARFERLRIDGVTHFLKSLSAERRLDHAGHRQQLELGVQGLAGRDLRRDPAGHRPHRRGDGPRGIGPSLGCRS